MRELIQAIERIKNQFYNGSKTYYQIVNEKHKKMEFKELMIKEISRESVR